MSAPARLDLENVVAGDDWALEVVIENAAGSPVDLTGRNYIAQVRLDPASTTAPELSFSCSVPTPANGTISLLAADADTADLVPGRAYWWSLLELAGGVLTTLLYGRVTVLWQVAKD
jgi:hypothetical protein